MIEIVLFGALVGACVWVYRTFTGAEVWGFVRESLGRLYPRRPIARRRLPRVLLREALSTRTIGVSGACLLPCEIELLVNPQDLEPFAGALGWLAGDIDAGLRAEGDRRGWHVPIALSLEIVPDATRTVGVPRAIGAFGADPVDEVMMETFNVDLAQLPTLAPTQSWPMVTVRVNHDEAVTLAVPEDGIVVGRATSCDVTLGSATASRRHCRITLRRGALEVEDLSRNGTAVEQSESGIVLRVGQDIVRVSQVTARPATETGALR